VAGLFSGIGGLESGLTKAGHSTVLLCENDRAACAVLDRWFPEIARHGDIRTLKSLPRNATLLAAGFPCQDLSQAGQTLGISGEKSGLVGEVFRLVEQHETPLVLLENVPFMLQLGGGAAMNLLTSSFERLGYAWAYRVIDARAFGLPQRRRRVYFLASRVGDPRGILFADDAGPAESAEPTASVACGFYWTEGIRGLGWAVDAVPTLKGGSGLGIPSPPAIVLPSGMVVTFDVRDAERLQGLPADWTKPAESVAKRGVRWRLVGNAVSVPAATWLGRRLANPGRVLDLEATQLKAGHSWPIAAWNVGEGRFSISISEWPVRRKQRPLESFLRYGTTNLSERATAGFLKRTERARLRFPAGFLDTMQAHLNRMSGSEHESANV
jgi:DNA (cytosine-5)-methyltransferase 1